MQMGPLQLGFRNMSNVNAKLVSFLDNASAKVKLVACADSDPAARSLGGSARAAVTLNNNPVFLTDFMVQGVWTC